MSIDDLYKRASIGNIASFLHYGVEWNEPMNSTYKERISVAENKISDFLQNNLPSIEKCETALDEFFVQIEECKNVYFELGLIMGAKILFELHSKVQEINQS